MVEELKVIQSVVRGDVESFRLLVERYAGPVTRMIRGRVDYLYCPAGDWSRCGRLE